MTFNLYTKKEIKLLLTIMSVVFILFFTSMSLVSATWDNPSFSAKKQLNISGGSVPLVDFTVRVNVSYDSDMQADFDDILFYNSSGSNLRYELDYKNDSNFAIFYIRIPNLNAGDFNTTIYMYYGNSSVTTSSDKEGAWAYDAGVWHFSEGAGTTVAGKNGLDNATLNAGTQEWVDGIFGKAIRVNGASLNWIVSDKDYFTPSNNTGATWLMWYKAKTDSPDYKEIWSKDGASGREWSIQQRNTYKLQNWLLDQGGSGYMYIDGYNNDISTTKYNMIGMYWNGGFTNNDMSVWVNSSDRTQTRNGVQPTFNSIDNTAQPIYFGYQNSNNRGADGYIDEAYIFNKTLSSAEMTRYYYNYDVSKFSFGAEETPIDSDNPSGFLIVPIDNLYTNMTTFNFTINATDNIGLSNITLFIYNGTVLIDSQLQSVSGTDGIFGIVYNFLSNGVFKWFFNIVDSAGNIFTTGNRTIVVDTVYPQLGIDYPQATYYPYQITNISHTVNETNIANCTFNNGSILQTITCNQTYFFNSSEGSNTWIITATDLVGQSYSKPVQFTQDTIYPQISYNLGTPTNDITVNETTLLVNVTVAESNFYSITFNLANSSGMIASDTFLTPILSVLFTNLTQGSYYYNVTVTDLAGNTNITSTYKYNVDITPPFISIISPTAQNYSYVSHEVNISSDGDLIYFYNGTGIEQYLGLVNRTYQQGYNNLTAYAQDNLGNTNSTSVYFLIDSIPPIVNFVFPTPADNRIQAESYTTINISVTDVSFKNSTISLYNSTYQIVAQQYSTNNPLSITITNMTNGNYQYNATSCDTFDNCVSTATRNITINKGLGLNLNLSLIVNQYPYVDFNTTYPIGVRVFYGSGIIEINANTTMYIRDPHGRNTTVPLTYNPTSENYENAVIFNETGDYPFLIVVNSPDFGNVNGSGTFLVRRPYNVTVKLFDDQNFNSISKSYAYVLAEPNNPRKTNGVLESFIYPITPNKDSAYHAPYVGGEAVLKLWDNASYNMRFLTGDITFAGTYASPNISKSYGINTYLGNYNGNGTSTTLQYVVGQKELYQYRWLANWVTVIALIMILIISAILFFMFPMMPWMSFVFGILFTVIIIAVRLAVWWFKSW